MALDSNIYQLVVQVSDYVHFRHHVRVISVISFIPCRYGLLSPVFVIVHGLIAISLNFCFP